MAKAKQAEFTNYDSATYLRTKADVAAHLKACMTEA